MVYVGEVSLRGEPLYLLANVLKLRPLSEVEEMKEQ